ncbi:MAG: hypothetical protein RI553_11970 [Salibaculum sp.]|uniref:hypothetical protein n=1 Tax=Salibaculum sp. TaxID=2855480 RepID=UPI00286FF2DA|nr:hypothetical protein [Salibaculum sp.]MDR9428809.1 hypothetical protein [Salibaculum sp.]
MEGVAVVRPTYETESDLRNERDVVEVFNKLWGTQAYKLPRAYSLDYLLTRGSDAVAFVEIKCRQVPSGKYDTLMISMAKILKGRAITRETGIPSVLVVKWNDKTGYVHMPEIDMDIRVGGRRDRGDAQDIEPVCMIPINSFRGVET